MNFSRTISTFLRKMKIDFWGVRRKSCQKNESRFSIRFVHCLKKDENQFLEGDVKILSKRWKLISWRVMRQSCQKDENWFSWSFCTILRKMKINFWEVRWSQSCHIDNIDFLRFVQHLEKYENRFLRYNMTNKWSNWNLRFFSKDDNRFIP